MKTNYSGIDYGSGLANIDHKTGIRYGVIHQGEVIQSWADSSTPVYPDCDCEDFCECEMLCFEYDDDGYKASQSGDDCDIFIVESPYYTTCQFCSPCAPGAGYIMNTVKDGVKAYCFGHEWFENGKAPYPVYDVKTGKKVNG